MSYAMPSVCLHTLRLPQTAALSLGWEADVPSTHKLERTGHVTSQREALRKPGGDTPAHEGGCSG